MKYFIFIFLLISSICFAQVNGELSEINGKRILRIWGDHQERGYAYGYLQAEEIKEVMEDYFLASVFYNSAYAYENARTYFEQHFEIETKYYTEAAAMVDGIEATGVSIFCELLNRDLDATDVLLANSIVDISAIFARLENPVHCSSISSWGESTLQDPELNSESIITRHLDWTPHQTILDNQLIIVSQPSEVDEQDWISFSISGLIGSLSGINECGVTAFMNVGSDHSVSDEQDLHPIFLSIRNGIESSDYDQSGDCDPQDVAAAITVKNNLSGSITHSMTSTENGDAIVIECNNESGVEVRTSEDNTQIPGDNLVATNHFRKLYDPVYCYRYENIVDSLNVSTEISSQRSWELLCGAAGITGNLQTIQFIPMNGRILWATSPTASQPAYTQIPSEFYLEELFNPTSVNQSLIENPKLMNAFPNPFQNSTTIFMNISSDPGMHQGKQNEQYQLEIYNIKGQRIRVLECINCIDATSSYQVIWDGRDSGNKEVASGIYYLKLMDGNKQIQLTKVVKVK